MRLFPVVVAFILLTAPLVALADDGAIQITFHEARDQSPDWSPDGSQVVFVTTRSNPDCFWVIPSTGGTATSITISPPLWGWCEYGMVRWSPDGSQIAFHQVNPIIGYSDISVAPSSGGERSRICTLCLSPDWSPDGSQIAFSYPYGGWPRNIWVIPSGGGYDTQITFGDFNDGSPTWSPDGTQIAFDSDRSGNADIWVIPSGGGGSATQITSDPSSDWGPSWSPDGSQIAFTSDRGGNRNIWVIPSSGGGSATQITSDPADDSEPSWSPDGTWIAFVSNRSGNRDIWVIDAEPPITVVQKTWGMIKGKYR